MITFTHGNKSFSLAPGSFVDNHLLDTEDATTERNKGNAYNSKSVTLLNIDGSLHSIVEIPTKTRQIIKLNEGGFPICECMKIVSITTFFRPIFKIKKTCHSRRRIPNIYNFINDKAFRMFWVHR